MKSQTMPSAKKKTTKSVKANPGYTFIESNIYKTGKSYRVRVGSRSEYATSLTKARQAKKLMKSSSTSTIF